jgi:predicted permease
MSLLRSLGAGIRGLFQKDHVEREMDEELRAYLSASVEDKVRQGMSRETALRVASSEMGSVEGVKEGIRSAGWESTVEGVWQDVRFGIRQLRLNPMFTAAALLSLALGIGANTTIFQLLDAVRMRTLPVRDPSRLAKIAIDHRNRASGNFSSRYSDLTFSQWERIRDQQEGFSSVLAWCPRLFNISPGGEVKNVQGLWVNGGFFDTLGVGPALGRLLTKEDDRPGCGTAGAVLSYSYWERAYGGDRSAIGRTLSIARHPFEIIGVSAPDFFGVEVGRSFDVALPLCAEPIISRENSQLLRADGWWLASIGRLKPGWTLERAGAQLGAISSGLFAATVPPNFSPEQAKHYLGYRLGVFPGGSGSSELRSNFEGPLWFLLALAGVVLMIASANLANLMLARAATREKEIGMRMALGASRRRLVRQLLVESLVLAGLGASLGAILAPNLSPILVASLSTENDPLFMDIATDWRVLLFTAGLACLTCILFGLTPALRATGPALDSVLRDGARGTTRGSRRFGLRQALVVSQIALSLALLVGALLFSRSMSNLVAVDAGFRQDGILVADVDFSARNLPKEQRLEFGEALLQRVRAIPGVEGAAYAEILPLSGDGMNNDLLLGDSDEHQPDSPFFNRITPGFFDAMGTPVLAGRDFDAHDRNGAPLAAIVNQAFARKYSNGRSPLGLTFRVGRMATVSERYQVVGLVKDTKYFKLREELQPIVYTAIAQDERVDSDAQILMRSTTPLGTLISEVKSAVNELDPRLDITFVPFHGMIQDGLRRDRLMAALSGFFGILAAVLSAVGLYGVISYMVEQRRNEIGIRMALGAGRDRVVRLVLAETAILLLTGGAIGIGLALVLSRAAASMLFGLRPTDPVTYLLAAGGLALVALGAGFWPARRAANLDPMVALREA